MLETGEVAMEDQERLKVESEMLLEMVLGRYGDRLTPEMVEGVRGAAETVAKTLIPLRSVKLENHDPPFVQFAPFRKRG
jgi:hypothetical protein